MPVRAALAFFLIVGSTNAFAEDVAKVDKGQTPPTKKVEYVDFLTLLPSALKLDQNIIKASFGAKGASESAKAARSGWYPKADITLNSAKQKDLKVGAANDTYNPTEAKLKITQKLWDFGETSNAIAKSDIGIEMAQIGLRAARNQAILKAATSYISLKKAYAQYKIATDSEAQLKKQTGIQDFRVNRGATVGTDVLQAKNALASAMTSRVAARGNYKRALSAFESTFGFKPKNIDALLPIRIPNTLIPADEESFKQLVMSKGDQVLRSRLAYDNAKITRDNAFASNFMPDFSLTTEFNYKGDASGTMGGKTEYIGKIEMTWPIELFGTQVNAYRAAGYAGDSAEVAYAQSVKSVKDMVSNTWIGFQLASINRANVTNQVSIAEQFLKIARLEVEKGRGQMLLVFNAQSALINARQSLQNNTSDYAVQVYNMLSQTGDLSLDKLLIASATEDENRQKAVEEYKKRMDEAEKVGEKVKEATEKKKKAAQ